RQEASETGSSGSSVARATVEVDSQSEVLCLCLPWSWLKSERPLLEALQKGFATSLAAQVAAGDAAARLLEYAAVLEMACYSQFEANVEGGEEFGVDWDGKRGVDFFLFCIFARQDLEG
ncbi:unnamed protein product, partial [Durusdinium trenchii]